MADEGPETPRVIHCRGLTRRYPGGILAVDHLELSVYRGEIFGLLGPNGAGKTTTVGMLTTLVIPTAGSATVACIDVVARALMHRPPVLFLDEPTAGLDPQSRIALWEILQKLHREGQTIFLSTHYMEEADSLCHRVAIMDHGRILVVDSPRALKASVSGGSIVTLSARGDPDRLAEVLRQRVEGAETSRRANGSIRLSVKGADGLVPKVLAAAEQAGYQVTDISVSPPTLETVFIALTGKELRE